MCLSDHVFGKDDVDFYHKQCEYLMNLCQARAALMRGGFAQRIAIDYMSISEVMRGPWGVYEDNEHMFSITDSDGMEYVDDNLTDDEFDALCGLYVTFTGNGRQTSKLSWYPLAPVFDGQGEDMGWWTDHAEALWNVCNASILADSSKSKFSLPMNVMKWHDRLHGYGDRQRAAKKLEALSRKFLEQHVGQL
ncbi:hypothetical protein AN958_09353 [Leucoagaricus sp. SymC.cos]|nr:hypothetical protein AN958_09353 [Leucoagaricus sp. SymC.cos]